ncbi:DUF222 domain-containing protein [Williamsia sterculiae]|nr:DUF222 domain-containing protein [Williamsia sterculiae]
MLPSLTADSAAGRARDLSSVFAALGDFDTDELLTVREALSDRLVGGWFVELDDEQADADVLAAAAKRDHRSAVQRNHDAFTLMLRTISESGALGQHRGLPAQVIVVMALEELEAETGIATTASGGPPVRDAPRPTPGRLTLRRPARYRASSLPCGSHQRRRRRCLLKQQDMIGRKGGAVRRASAWRPPQLSAWGYSSARDMTGGRSERT